MNRIQRIAAAAAISTAVLAPATAAVAPAYAKPYEVDLAPASTQAQTEQLLRQEQQYMQEAVDEELLREEQQYMQERLWPEPVGETSDSGDTTGFPWDTVTLATLGTAALAAGGAVIIVRRRHVPHTA
jgi:hypothetical protein